MNETMEITENIWNFFWDNIKLLEKKKKIITWTYAKEEI